MTMIQKGAWRLRFEPGEIEARMAAGEWSGKTLADYARDRLAERPDAIAVVGEHETKTFRELYADATAFARGLFALGLQPGDTISFQLPNWPSSMVIDLGCALGGFVLNPVIPIYRQRELRFILKDAHARAIFIPAGTYRGVDYAQLIADVRPDVPELAHVLSVPDDYEALLARGRASSAELPVVDVDGAKLIIYTSGTTGDPKGVIYSHNQGPCALATSIRHWPVSPGDRVLMPSPVTHITGAYFGLEAPFVGGSQTIFMDRWDAARAVDLIEQHGVRVMVGATPFLAELVREAEAKGTGLPSLEIFACGGAAIPPDLIRHSYRVFANCRTFRVYGSTECPMTTEGNLSDPERSATSDGQRLDYALKTVGPDGEEVFGTEGEILIKGRGMFRGYTSAAANAESFDESGYFRSGDLGTITAGGVVTITGRKKDIIIRGGENVSAKDVEDTLHRHPGVRIASVVAMPHARLGEGVCAFIVPHSGPVSLSELHEFLAKEGLARQKWPDRIELVDTLPTTASGKVQKHVLRKMIADAIAADR